MKTINLLAALVCIVTVQAQKSGSARPQPKKFVYDTARFVLVEGGTFKMGSDEPVEPHESPAHEVTLKPFIIGKTEVTFEEYDKYLLATRQDTAGKSLWGRGKQPAITVSWLDAVAYCNWLSEREGLSKCYIIKGDKVTWVDTAKGYRLPTEAEWEFAARGGNKSKNTLYAGSKDLNEVAWYKGNSGERTHPVASKKPNELGLYDMNGNVWEWVWDVYDWNYYKYSPADNPRGPDEGPYRVMRGGAFYNDERYVRVSTRQNAYVVFKQNSVGFRVARSYQPQ
ncbi:MAG: formylglycine-generating enzyme family protein [Chitinophagales bacterium]|nr:formylglycine-generating enzyme family protein [Chitinophagales bacterium]MDW8418945.1 formylglycine-generating enzyme family protein [Chitinophagales bacterium]